MDLLRTIENEKVKIEIFKCTANNPRNGFNFLVPRNNIGTLWLSNKYNEFELHNPERRNKIIAFFSQISNSPISIYSDYFKDWTDNRLYAYFEKVAKRNNVILEVWYNEDMRIKYITNFDGNTHYRENIGYIFISKEDACIKLDKKRINATSVRLIKEILNKEILEFSQYLNNIQYTYFIKNKDTDSDIINIDHFYFLSDLQKDLIKQCSVIFKRHIPQELKAQLCSLS